MESEILRSANSANADFRVVPVTRENVAKVSLWPRAQSVEYRSWPRSGRGGMSPIIAAGDTLNLVIWENADNPLLTSGAQKSVEMNEIIVDNTGKIFLPYLGSVRVSGQSPEAARDSLQQKLTGVLTSPQVQLTVKQGRQNTVDLVGGVARAGNYPLPDQNFTVLGLLSAGGGITGALRNPQLRLVRSGAIYGVSAKDLMSDPSLDTVLRGRDKVIVTEDDRYFLALGASSSQKQIYFPQDKVTALDAVTLIGGVQAQRGNPKGVLILREYPASALRNDASGPDRDRVIFSLDLTSADGLFSAGRFPIEPNDLVLATESPVNGLRTIMGLVTQGAVVADRLDGL
ncbi:polysaccharide biosynthesis/export family protein [Phaeovulum sp. W22_SRMD_FR3]